MTRRDFISRLLGGAAAVALSPLLDLAPIIEAPSAVGETAGISTGILALLDDGTIADTYYGITRTLTPMFKSYVMQATGVLSPTTILDTP